MTRTRLNICVARKSLIIILFILTAAGHIQAEPINVGAILPLSGDTAVWGQQIRKGVELAAAESGNFMVTFEDEGFCDSTRAVGAYQRLLAQKKVGVVITGCLNGTKAIIPLAKRDKVLLLSAGLLDEETFAGEGKLLSLVSQISNEAQAVAESLKKEHLQRVAMLRVEDTFTEEMLKHLRRHLETEPDAGQVIADEPVSFTETDFRTRLLKLAPQKPSVIFVYLGAQQLVAFMRQRSALQNSIPVFGGYMVESNPLSSADLLGIEGIKYTYPRLAEETDPQRVNFDRRYRKRYGEAEVPTANTYCVYDGVKILGEALNKCASSGRLCLFDYFVDSGKPRAGVSGNFSFLPDGRINRPYGSKKVIGGRYLWLAPQ